MGALDDYRGGRPLTGESVTRMLADLRAQQGVDGSGRRLAHAFTLTIMALQTFAELEAGTPIGKAAAEVLTVAGRTILPDLPDRAGEKP